MSEKNAPVPVFITLIGNTAVGKSYYLFSLGLSLRKYRPVRDWIVSSLSEDYEKQIETWIKDHQEKGRLSPNDLGDNIQLSFVVENTVLNRNYEIIIADMAGEEIVRYLKNKEIYRRIANDIKMRIRFSSGILLMMDFTKLHFHDEVDAWMELLKMNLFRTTDICLMKADTLDPVKEKLQPEQDKIVKNPSTYPRNRSLLDDNELEKHAEAEFFKPITEKIKNYIDAKKIETRYHYISSVGILHENEELPKMINHEFISYNIFKPILDILENQEDNFEKGFYSKICSICKKQIWSSILKKAKKTYYEHQYREAMEMLGNEKLLSNTQKHYDIFEEFNRVLGEIHSDWIQERKDRDNLLPAKDKYTLLKNILENIKCFRREVIDEHELHREKEKYVRKLRQELLPLKSQNSVDFGPAVELLHEQYQILKQDYNNDSLQEPLKVLREEYSDITLKDNTIKELAQTISELIEEQIKQVYSALIRGNSDYKHAVLSHSQLLTLYIAIRNTRMREWRRTLESEIGLPESVGERIREMADIVLKEGETHWNFSAIFKYLKIAESALKKQNKLFNVPAKYFANNYRQLDKARLTVFSKKIPAVGKMGKESSDSWYFKDDLFEFLTEEWDFWNNEKSEFHPPLKLAKRFPGDLSICPRCNGMKEIKNPCSSCLEKFWLVRIFQTCDICNNTRKVTRTCPHCDGYGKRKFARNIYED